MEEVRGDPKSVTCPASGNQDNSGKSIFGFGSGGAEGADPGALLRTDPVVLTFRGFGNAQVMGLQPKSSPPKQPPTVFPGRNLDRAVA